MGVERLHLILPHDAAQPASGTTMHNGQYVALLEDFKAQGGRELLLGGVEPLAFPGFWYLVKQAQRLKLARVTACLSGGLLEPQVVRTMVSSGLYLLVGVDSVTPEGHDSVHGGGSHARAVGALRRLLDQELSDRLGVMSVATSTTWHELPDVATWAFGQGVRRFWWSIQPQGLGAISLREKAQLLESLADQQLPSGCYAGPLDETVEGGAPHRWLRVLPQGDAAWGLHGEGPGLGNVRRRSLLELLESASWQAGA